MKNNKILKTLLSSIIITIITTINIAVYATNLNLNVDYNGKTIEMLSETPEMKWQINNIQPNQASETTLTINSIGNKDVTVEFNIEAEEEKEIAQNLNIKIENKKTGEILYEGKYEELSKINTKVKSKETNTYKIIITAQEEKYSEVQNKKIVFKFIFLAKGAKINLASNSNEAELEDETEEITTNIIKPIKTGTSYTIIVIVLATLIITLIVLIILKLKINKKTLKI